MQHRFSACGHLAVGLRLRTRACSPLGWWLSPSVSPLGIVPLSWALLLVPEVLQAGQQELSESQLGGCGLSSASLSYCKLTGLQRELGKMVLH